MVDLQTRDLNSFLDGLLIDLGHVSSEPTVRADRGPNALSRLPASVRPHLLTLHVLFPHILLDALDILDRDLITRLTVGFDDTTRHSRMGGGLDTNKAPRIATVDALEADDTARAHKIFAEERAPFAPAGVTNVKVHGQTGSQCAQRVTHYARSAQVPYHRPPLQTEGQQRAPASTQIYQVQLRTWHCSCAAFAHSAFLPLEVPSDMRHTTQSSRHSFDRSPYECHLRSLAFGFGGLPVARQRGYHTSTAGPSDSAQLPPICKHLMACVLAELAPSVFGHVQPSKSQPEAPVTQEEGSGPKHLVHRLVSIEESAGWSLGVPVTGASN